MRLDAKKAKIMNDYLNEGRKVSRVSFSEEDIKSVCNTINMINALPYGKAVVEGELLSDYEIPRAWSALIQPARVRFSSDIMAKDYKDTDAYKSPGKVAPMSSTRFKLVWRAIIGSYKGAEDFISVRDCRNDAMITDIGKKGVLASMNSCIDDGIYIPSIITLQTYDDLAYTIDIDKMFEKWLTNLIMA